jgi:hypothetical protein
MASYQFFYPMMSWEHPYRGDICTELNVERYSLHKDGSIGYRHPAGTHDDVFWATALAVYATANMEPEPTLTIIQR